MIAQVVDSLNAYNLRSLQPKSMRQFKTSPTGKSAWVVAQWVATHKAYNFRNLQPKQRDYSKLRQERRKRSNSSPQSCFAQCIQLPKLAPQNNATIQYVVNSGKRGLVALHKAASHNEYNFRSLHPKTTRQFNTSPNIEKSFSNSPVSCFAPCLQLPKPWAEINATIENFANNEISSRSSQVSCSAPCVHLPKPWAKINDTIENFAKSEISSRSSQVSCFA